MPVSVARRRARHVVRRASTHRARENRARRRAAGPAATSAQAVRPEARASRCGTGRPGRMRHGGGVCAQGAGRGRRQGRVRRRRGRAYDLVRGRVPCPSGGDSAAPRPREAGRPGGRRASEARGLGAVVGRARLAGHKDDTGAVRRHDWATGRRGAWGSTAPGVCGARCGRGPPGRRVRPRRDGRAQRRRCTGRRLASVAAQPRPHRSPRGPIETGTASAARSPPALCPPMGSAPGRCPVQPRVRLSTSVRRSAVQCGGEPVLGGRRYFTEIATASEAAAIGVAKW